MLSRKVVVVITALGVVSYAAAVLLVAHQTTDIGLRCAFETDIQKVSPEYLPAELNPAGIPKLNDRLTQVGSVRIETWSHFVRAVSDLHDVHKFPRIEVASDADASALNALPQRNTHVVSRGGQELIWVEYEDQETGAAKSCWCMVGRPPTIEMLQSLVWFTLKLCLFALAAVVLWNRPNDEGTWRFFLLCTVTIGAFMGGYHWFRIAGTPPLVVLFMICAVLLPVVSLHFYLNFPTPKRLLRQRPRLTLAALYSLPLLLLAGMLATYFVLVWTYRSDEGTESLARVKELLNLLVVQIKVTLALSAALFAGCVATLVHSYRNTRSGSRERNQVKWILLAAILASIPISYALYLAVTDTDQFSVGGAAWPMFLASLFFTLGYGVSISRYSLMEIGQVLNWGIVSLAVSLAAGLVYSALVFVGTLLIGTRIEHLSAFRQAAWVSLTALVLLLALDLIRWRLRRAIDRTLHRDRFQLEKTLHRMSQTVDQMVDAPMLCRRLLHALSELLGFHHGAVYLRDRDAAIWRLAASLEREPALKELMPGAPLIDALEQSPLVRYRPAARLPLEPAQRQLEELGCEIAIPLRYEGTLLAVLLVGPASDASYGAEELHLLTAFAQVAVLALHGARGHQTIDHLRKELQDKVEKLSEQQRRIVFLQGQLLRIGMGDPKSAGENGAAVNGAAATHPAPAAAQEIVGSSPIVRHLLQVVQKVAASSSAVLIRGESGTGKELLARALHAHSPRAERPFVKVHCAALSPGLLESELFGHVKGAFTGALKDKVGRFEMADGGTLFLDEIGDISLDVQTKLLRVLQEMSFERVGSSEPLKVDVRIIAATNQNLEKLMRDGRFREDLFYRLNVITIYTPPLRDRREDIYELALHFLRLHSERNRKTLTNIDDEALELLKAYDWPGNVRELENVVERAVVLADTPIITARELPAHLQDLYGLKPPPPVLSPPAPAGRSEPAAELDLQAPQEEWGASQQELERDRLVRALAAAQGNKSRAARALRMPRSTLVSKLEKYGLLPRRTRD